MATTRWNLWVKGRLRRRIVLTDEGGAVVAELSMPHGKRRRRRRPGTADDDAGRRWTMQDEGSGVVVREGGLPVASVRDRELHAGALRLPVTLLAEGPRSALVEGSADDAPILRVRASGGRRRPWAVLDVAPDLDPALPPVLAVSYALLCDEADDGAGVLDVLCELVTAPF